MDDRFVLRILTSPQDTALDGKTIASGRILEWIDRAGYACAVGFSKSYCVTAYVGNVRFTMPVFAGQLVELKARIIQTGRTSMQVWVTVSSADVASGDAHHAMDCILVFVAVDSERRPRLVPPWQPTDDEGATLQKRAEERLIVRKAIKDSMMGESYSERGTTPQSRFRFLAAPGDANWGGNAHGGTVMRWVHEAAYSAAARWSSTSATAIYSGGIHFLRPIRIGHVVEIDARIIHVVDDEMHVSTRVSSAPAEEPTALQLTTVCMSIYIDSREAGVRRHVPPLRLLSDEDRRLSDHARDLMELRGRLSSLGPMAGRPAWMPTAPIGMIPQGS